MDEKSKMSSFSSRYKKDIKLLKYHPKRCMFDEVALLLFVRRNVLEKRIDTFHIDIKTSSWKEGGVYHGERYVSE